MSNDDEESIAVLVVSSDPLARAALTRALESERSLKVVGRSDMGTELGGALARLSPDVLLFDAGLALDEPPDALREAPAPTAWLVASLEAAAEGLRGGARAVLRRDVEPEALAAALRSVSLGLSVLDSGFVAQLLGEAAPWMKRGGADLTAREREVLEQLARGLSNKVIADKLSISEHTVKFHVNAVMSKLNAQSRTEAVVLAARRGWLTL